MGLQNGRAQGTLRLIISYSIPLSDVALVWSLILILFWFLKRKINALEVLLSCLSLLVLLQGPRSQFILFGHS